MSTEADRARDNLVVVQRGSDTPPPGGLEGAEINAIRFLAIDAVERAKSGHPGTPMGLAPLAYRPFTRHLCHDPALPDWHVVEVRYLNALSEGRRVARVARDGVSATRLKGCGSDHGTDGTGRGERQCNSG